MLILLDDAARVLIIQLVRADGDELRQSRRRKATLREPQTRIVDRPISSDERSEADAARGVALGEAVHDDRELLSVRQLERADRAAAVVDKLAIDLIGDEKEPVIAAKCGDRFELIAAVDRSGRIVRIADDHDTRSRSERALPHLPLRQM